MYKMLCIIPARGGSKRLPRKNILEFMGKSLIVRAIETAKESDIFDRIIVMTDDDETASIAKKAGAEIPFTEPTELASDTAYVGDALRDLLQKLEDTEHYVPKSFMLLEPSNVGRTVAMIREAAVLFSESSVDSLVAISEVPKHVGFEKQLSLSKEGIVTRASDGAPLKSMTHRNQDISVTYFINSALYIFLRRNLFEGEKNLWGNSTLGFPIDASFIQDIDTEEDWELALSKKGVRVDGQAS